MPLPKVSGLLNNCALNSALPILLEGIHQLALREARGEALEGDFYPQYQRLKDLFAHHYGVDGHPAFDWQAFDAFLGAHSFYANEMMFAPVLRCFIAELGLASGSYLPEDIGLLRDVQSQGRYHCLENAEACALFHHQFGISVLTYEYVGNKKTDNPRDNYCLVDTRITAQRPSSGDLPMVSLYLKNVHFEIQPHESLAEATAAFVHEVESLPEALARIHDGLSTSQNAQQSNRNLGRLVVYVQQAIYRQLATKKIPEAKDYIMSAQEYALKGRAFHRDTLAGRQTFAVVLLTILLEQGEKHADSLLLQLDNLAFAANGNQILASYLLDQLATAIITARGDLDDESIRHVLEQIETNHIANEQISFISKRKNEHAQLAILANDLIQQAWQAYQVTKDDHFIAVIQQTQALAIQPTQQQIGEYHALQEDMRGKGVWGRVIAGLMLTLLGVALIAGAALGLVTSLGLAAPLSIPVAASGVASVAAGIGFFSYSNDPEILKDMHQVGVKASTQLIA